MQKSFEQKSSRRGGGSKQGDYFNEESLCVTEENRFENAVNPIKLADLAWGDDYKLDKLIKQ
jgi:hypothetical protein